MADRLLIIGWDGADWEIVDDLIARGDLPNVRSMLAEGARGDLLSTVPSHSWAAWSTFLTGVNPGRHGVFDFVERHPTDPTRRIPVTALSIKSGSFLGRLGEAGHGIRVANVPVTYPPFPVNGRLISGAAIPPGTEFVYPKDWAEELSRRAPFPINGMEWVRHRNDPEVLVADAQRLVRERTASYEVLLEGDWSVAVCVYLAPDRLQHPYGAYLLPTHPRHAELSASPLGEALRGVFRTLDEEIGRLRAAAGDDATVVLMSDHGFRPVTHTANLDRILQRLGFASRSRTASATLAVRRASWTRKIARTTWGRAIRRRVSRPSTVDWSRTVAYQSASGGGVSLNVRGREPDGTVDPKDFERVAAEVRDALLEFRVPGTDVAPVARVLRKEELYDGPYAEVAPDFLVQPQPLWTFSHTDSLAQETDWPTGGHRRRGIVVAAGARVRAGDLGERHIADVAATALAFCGVPVSGLDGTAIEPISGKPAVEAPVEPVDDGRVAATGVQISDEEHDYVAQHLRDLGYIE